jgi:hypothetical protein
MIFTHLARLLAGCALVVGGLMILGSLGMPGEIPNIYPGRTPGQVIDKGFEFLAIALVVGTLAEISLSVRK